MKQKKWVKSQSVQIILFVILVSLLMLSLGRFEDTIKLIGFPFKIIPNVLGLTQDISKNEVAEYKILANTTIDVPIEHPGYYYVFTPFFYNWSYGPDIEIKSPQGDNVELKNWLKISRFYDTIHVRGFPAYRFLAEESGTYKFHFIPSRDTSLTKKFNIGVVPDYITGRENIYRNAYIIQITILIVIGSMTYYYKVGKASIQRKKSKKALGDKKRNQMDDFMKSNYKKQ